MACRAERLQEATVVVGQAIGERDRLFRRFLRELGPQCPLGGKTEAVIGQRKLAVGHRGRAKCLAGAGEPTGTKLGFALQIRFEGRE